MDGRITHGADDSQARVNRLQRGLCILEFESRSEEIACEHSKEVELLRSKETEKKWKRQSVLGRFKERERPRVGVLSPSRTRVRST